MNIFYTSPTAIRALMRFGDEMPKKCVHQTEWPLYCNPAFPQSMRSDVVLVLVLAFNCI